MTEEEWQTASDPVAMLRKLDRPRGDRKLRLFLVACCRARWDLLVEAPSRDAVEWAERFADGLSTRDVEYERLEWACEGAFFKYDHQRVRMSLDDPRFVVVSELADVAYLADLAMFIDTTDPYRSDFDRERPLLLVAPLRDIFGNPFQPVPFDPSWRTTTAVAIAKRIYDSRDFSAMPILADALQDAGCERVDILDHCRGPGPHVKGCWVVDLVLGKE